MLAIISRRLGKRIVNMDLLEIRRMEGLYNNGDSERSSCNMMMGPWEAEERNAYRS